MTQHIAFYGKGGVGKSTLATNLGSAMAEAGQRVLLIGCDPKADTGILLHSEETVRPILDMAASGESPTLTDIVKYGFGGIACIEVGDAMAIGECASYGINRAFTILQELRVFDELQPDCVLYDIPGETGCSGFSSPILNSLIQQAFVVTSADLMSLYAANSFFRLLERKCGSRAVSGGLIANGLTGSFEESLVTDFARQLNTRVAGAIPRSLVVRQCELYGKTVIEAAPLSNLAYSYRRLAHHLINSPPTGEQSAPQPLLPVDLKRWAKKWGDRIGELEFGIIQDGAGI
jgi:nitrogenase iron protein NifH